jgi:hypothetical protein
MHQRTAAALIGQWARIFRSGAVSFASLFDASQLIESGTHPPFFAHFFSCAKHRLYEISQRIALFLRKCVA